MILDWNSVVSRLRRYPKGIHELREPCPPERIRALEVELGPLPDVLKRLVEMTNGAKLFIAASYAGPMVRLFGVSSDPLDNPMEWAPDNCMDVMAPTYRALSGDARGWPFAMTTDGCLMVLLKDGSVLGWDEEQRRWSTMSEWVEDMFAEGDAMLRELDEEDDE